MQPVACDEWPVANAHVHSHVPAPQPVPLWWEAGASRAAHTVPGTTTTHAAALPDGPSLKSVASQTRRSLLAARQRRAWRGFARGNRQEGHRPGHGLRNAKAPPPTTDRCAAPRCPSHPRPTDRAVLRPATGAEVPTRGRARICRHRAPKDLCATRPPMDASQGGRRWRANIVPGDADTPLLPPHATCPR